MKQPGFFDVEERLSRLSGLGDQLEAFSRTVNFEAFRPDLDKALSLLKTQSDNQDRNQKSGARVINQGLFEPSTFHTAPLLAEFKNPLTSFKGALKDPQFKSGYPT